ncbi:hypothetical protein ACNFU2_19355 [Chryseobacterium sp. PTM-20240506]|uniref:hypothetical protein n=1 Tax=unclassified Chryseobacterium TaxID=2593645 RepID=UPI002796891A|nr:hypothetical protein [Chryseobacterium sp. CKR4-1]MDQ1802415.1 hypothetical protein [Chryseobacterium sp. CKR4-1]
MKYFIAVYQKLKNTYLSQSSMENDLPMICPSLRVYENEELELLKPQNQLNDDQKKALSIIKKQNMAYELNSVPISSQFWDLNPNNSLFDIYRDILDKNNLKNLEESLDKTLAIESSILFDAKKNDTKEFKAYKKYRLAHEQVIDKITAHLELFDDLDSDEERNNWNDQLTHLNGTKEIAFSDWKIKGNKDNIDKELTRINKASDADVYLAMAQNAKNTFEAAEKTDVITNASIHDINFIPYDFMENESGWNNIRIEKQELETLYTEAKNSHENLPSEILSIDYDEGVIQAVELDYSFVHLKRNWFSKNFMLSQLFEWNEPKKISDGQTISSDFKLPAFPKTMILIKNLKIILDPSITNDAINNPDQLIYFGPLIMKQQLFVNKNNNQKFLKAITNVKTIKSDQLSNLTRKTALYENSKITATEFITKPESEPVAETAKVHPIPAFNRINMNVLNSVRNVRPVTPVSTPQPITPAPPVKPVIPIRNTGIFVPIKYPIQVPSSGANIQFRVLDKINNDPVYKCSISIKGTNNSRIYEIETNEAGIVNQVIALGEYSIELRIDDYSVLNQNFSVTSTTPINLEYKLQREEVKFKSFFLIGMICEKMPKIPVS